MTFIVGLTGGIGCGKSSASRFFSDLGIDVIDTDLIAQKLTQSGGSAIPMIRNAFGNAFISADNALDRNKMRNLAFSDSDARLKLEKILHPLILKETVLQIKQTRSPYIIIAVPLLLETNDYNDIIQRILVIDCDEQQQLSRTMERSQLSEQMIKAIIAAQIPRKIRLQKADDIIINNQNLDQLKAQVFHLHLKYLTLSKGETSSLKS